MILWEGIQLRDGCGPCAHPSKPRLCAPEKFSAAPFQLRVSQPRLSRLLLLLVSASSLLRSLFAARVFGFSSLPAFERQLPSPQRAFCKCVPLLASVVLLQPCASSLLHLSSSGLLRLSVFVPLLRYGFAPRPARVPGPGFLLGVASRLLKLLPSCVAPQVADARLVVLLLPAPFVPPLADGSVLIPWPYDVVLLRDSSYVRSWPRLSTSWFPIEPSLCPRRRLSSVRPRP